MGLQWSSKIIKYLLFLFNLLFVITALIIISVGVTIKAKYARYDTFLDHSYFSIPNLLIATGSIIFFIAFFGCCGAIKENYCMTITFSTLLVLIFILELSAGISGYVLRSSTSDYLEAELTKSIKQYQPNVSKDNTSLVTIMWDTMQSNFNCCGIHSYKDWGQAGNTTNRIPITCCDVVYGAVGQYTCDEDSTTSTLYTVGCAEAFGNYLKEHAYTLGSVGLVFAFIQFIGIVFACRLAKQLKYYDHF